MKFSIFSHTPAAMTKNSQALHRADFDGDEEGRIADLVGQELVQRGHKIVDVRRQNELNGGQARQRRNRH
jgi:hypothetical protein